MRTVIAVFAVLSLTLCAGAARAGGGAEEAFLGPCRAHAILDGDTVDVRCGSEIARVRLLDVAAPERGEVGYTEAGRALRQLLAGRELWLGFALADQPIVDRDGRALVHLYDVKGRNLNVELVRLGWAAYSTRHGPGRFPANFRAAQAEARTEQRALWSVWSVTAESGQPSR